MRIPECRLRSWPCFVGSEMGGTGEWVCASSRSSARSSSGRSARRARRLCCSWTTTGRSAPRRPIPTSTQQLAPPSPATRIVVCPGTYGATTVDKRVTLSGYTKDLSTKLSVCSDRLHNPADQTTKNSIVAGFYVSADFATIKGFTVTAPESGINIPWGTESVWVTRNVLQDNSIGVNLNGTMSRVDFNCIRENNHRRLGLRHRDLLRPGPEEREDQLERLRQQHRGRDHAARRCRSGQPRRRPRPEQHVVERRRPDQHRRLDELADPAELRHGRRRRRHLRRAGPRCQLDPRDQQQQAEQRRRQRYQHRP